MQNIKKVKLDKLFFEYIPGRISRELFPGPESVMLQIRNSPHYKFIKLYDKIGLKIWDCYESTDYIQLMHFRGRDEAYNRKKVARFIKTYNSIRKRGFLGHIVVRKNPKYKRFFESGYEIAHGHHRATICCILGKKTIKCLVKEN